MKGRFRKPSVLYKFCVVISGILLISQTMACSENPIEDIPEKIPDGDPVVSVCARDSLTSVSSATGSAYVFETDPMIASGDQNLSINTTLFDSFRQQVTLERLGGRGVLEGDYVEVRNGLQCGGWFRAYSGNNQFLYSHSSPEYQEAMTYHYGDQYQAFLQSIGYLENAGALKIISHCMNADNAYYARWFDGNGVFVGENICLGDSVAAPGSSYSDDATVVLHELQHASTTWAYSNTPAESLNQYWYDEAGALNEALSDFMTLSYVAPTVLSPFDPKIFSRWALGKFRTGSSGIRGAHKCTAYDPTFPTCNNYQKGPSGVSADANELSISYPDAVGWPFADNYVGPGLLQDAFLRYRGQEEIHSTGMVIVGALWDAYESLKTIKGEHTSAHRLMASLVMETLKHVDHPSASSQSPVTFRHFAQTMLDWALTVGFTQPEKNALKQTLEDRGLSGNPLVGNNWAAVGTGKIATPGLSVKDNPTDLKTWLAFSGRDYNVITHGIDTGLNRKMDGGEIVAVWFDIQNNDNLTAGGLQVEVKAQNSKVTFLDENFNDGYVSPTISQIFYHKVNGTDVVSSLTSANPDFHVSTGNTYFLTNPHFDDHWTTALWIKLDNSVASGESINFELTITPTNGSVSTVVFPVTAN